MKTIGLTKAVLILLLFFLAIGGLILAKPFLVPLAFAGIFAMLFLPLTQKLESKGVHRGIAAILCILILLAVLGIIAALLGWQLAGLAEDISDARQNISDMINKARHYISSRVGISGAEQEAFIKKQQLGASAKGGAVAQTILAGFGSILTNFVLVLVYIFLVLYFRNRLRTFVLKLVPSTQKNKANKIMSESVKVSKRYLTGTAIMIVCLWVLYGIGFSIVGVKHGLFFAVLCGVLEIVPFVGNLTGTALTILMALTQGGSIDMVIGVVAVYGTVQFIQSYFLETLVVGSEVNINPLFTIIGLILGELIWGISGMILAIPLMGITKIVFDNIPALQPFGYLIGSDEKENTWKEKIKDFFSNSKKQPGKN